MFKSSLCIFRVRYYRIGHCVDWRLSLKTLLNWFLKNGIFGLLLNLHTCNSLVEFFRIGKCDDVIFFLFSLILSSLPMCHTRLFGLRILNFAQWSFERCQFWPSIKPLIFLPEKKFYILNWTLR